MRIPRRLVLAYLLMVLVLGAGILWLLRVGSGLETGNRRDSTRNAMTSAAEVRSPPPTVRAHSWREALTRPLGLLLLQIIVVVLMARVFGKLFALIGQPPVIGEIAAGIVLGPSLFGRLFPGMFQALFPTTSLELLKILSQIGIVLFLFVVGLELDVKRLRAKVHAAVVISHASILLPCLLGVALSLFLYRTYAGASVSFCAFALFMGIAMSITAFPVLARILEDSGLSRTPLGNLAITCAAADDVTAWTLLAVVVSVATAGGPGSAVWTLTLVVAFVLLMLLLVQPLLRRVLRPAVERGVPTKAVTAAVLLLLFGSALATEVIGIHALFGAFLAGIIMPTSERFRGFLKERLESFSSILLLPLFFALTGLRTQIGLLSDAGSWIACGAIVAVATLGKLGGTMAAARWTGLGWNDSFAIGALMNTRGLIELIALNVGYDLGILSPRIFVMMVLMALVTTLSTQPLLSLAARLRNSGKPGILFHESAGRRRKPMVSFGNEPRVEPLEPVSVAVSAR